MTKALRFTHAFMGCEAVSALYRKEGPISGFKKLQNDREMQKLWTYLTFQTRHRILLQLQESNSSSIRTELPLASIVCDNIYKFRRGRVTSFQLNTGAGLSNRDIISLSHPLFPQRQTTCCISFVMGAKKTPPEIVSAREVGSRAPPLCARESCLNRNIPRMNAIPRRMSKLNVPAPQPERIAQNEDDFNERY
ncbi:hypothetical protein AVEN_40426-1 [Araneus ventricosus]|uniref:Uncharacterized protein n=1 Tax=Araneus ventricosus TaxID=182803 RepID=A0A4Y2D9W1_ARAVE|nr:hypothetical protein AVEN_40426-1 [Araneus ventricosus]